MSSPSDSHTSQTASSTPVHDAPITQSQLNQILNQFAQQITQQFQQSQAASAAATTTPITPHTSTSLLRPIPHNPQPHAKISPPNQYTGETNSNVNAWLFQMEQYLDNTAVVNDHLRISYASSYLKESAFQWWYHLVEKEHRRPNTWEEFQHLIRERFQPLAASRTARTALRGLRQAGRSVRSYTDEFMKLIQLIDDMSEADKREQYMNGLQPSIYNEVDIRDPQTLLAAQTLAQNAEIRHRNVRQNISQTTNYNNRPSHNYSTYHRKNYPSSSRSSYDGENKTVVTTSSSTTSTPMELSALSTSDQYTDEREYNDEYEQYLQYGDEFHTSNSSEEEQVVEDDQRLIEDVEEQLHAIGVPSRQASGGRVAIARLNREEFGRLMREGKCLRCKKSGHIARNCNLPPPAGWRNNIQPKSSKF